MAKIIGNIKPEDDYTHPLGPEPNFNESVYFNSLIVRKTVGDLCGLGIGRMRAMPK